MIYIIYYMLNDTKYSTLYRGETQIIFTDDFHENKTNLIDVFVCFDKVNGELPQGS